MSDPTPSDQDEFPDALIADAGAWFARMHSDQVTSDDESDFAKWLDENPHHRRAYDEVATVWQGIGALRGDPDLRTALGRLQGDADKTRTDRRAFFGAAAAGVAVLGVGAWFGRRFIADMNAYETGFGEQRKIDLNDGSVVTLNTETRVRVDLTGADRRLWLDRGQAYFNVAHDASRPFRVFVNDAEVRVLGTSFEVHRETAYTAVTLVEGSVRIMRGREAAHPQGLVLEPGQRAIIATDAIQRSAIDAGRVTAWVGGRMILDADPLRLAVSEINRYNSQQIVIDSRALEEMRISGVFQTRSPSAFAEALETLLPVAALHEDDGTIHLVQVVRE